MLGTLVTGNALSWYNPYLENPDLFNTIFQLGQGSKKNFQDIDWNDAALRSQFYYGLSSEIKDALVHFDNPSSVSAAMDMAIRIDNRLFERRQEQRLNHQQPSSSYSPATPSISCFKNQQQQQQIFFKPRQPANQTRSDSFINLPSARPIKKSNNHMDIDFVRRGPLSSLEREHRMKQGLCLVCGKAGHRKTTCLKSRFNSDSSRNIHAIQTEATKQQDSGKADSTSFKETVKFSQTIF
ncbi:hypothetical protein BASA83_010190 [Batrachochytrium salamandrivorans]|nr:hypothetical protein BASA83_010190 [Batrachochytrium salamandrivorans]